MSTECTWVPVEIHVSCSIPTGAFWEPPVSVLHVLSGTAPCQFFFVTKFQVWCSSTFCTADRNLWPSPCLWEQYITVRKGQPKKEVRISALTVPRKAKWIWKQRQIRKLRNANHNVKWQTLLGRTSGSEQDFPMQKGSYKPFKQLHSIKGHCTW